MTSLRLLCGALVTAFALPARANYADDTGFTQLAAELGAAMLTGNGVGVTQVEAAFFPNAYMPQGGTGTFPGTGYWTGKTFTAKSGPGVESGHASDVALHLYGTNTNASYFRVSMSPGVQMVDCYNANTWDDEFLAPLPDRPAPATEVRAVQNHAWIFEADASNATTVRDHLRRQDYSINQDNYVCCAGLNNGSASPIPDLFAAGYNVISVGLTNGDHSRGLTTSDMDGPGRRKPEIVAPLEATSFSTAYLSSAAALLREKANLIGTTNARRTKTLKAVLLAGATKDEFPGWAKSAAHPIDSIYGAGELNIYNSYHILNGGEQPPNDPGGRPHRAWDNLSLSGTSTADYRLTIPAGTYGVELSAFVVWHRTLTDGPAAGFNLTPNELVNYDLTLFLDPVSGGAPATIDSSASTLYNIEHVWKKNLPAGNYRLRVNRGTGTTGTHDFSIAWRLSTAPHQPTPLIGEAGGNFNFTFPNLLPGQPYQFQSSANMVTWTDIESFTATAATETRVLPKPGDARLFYRLIPVQL